MMILREPGKLLIRDAKLAPHAAYTLRPVVLASYHRRPIHYLRPSTDKNQDVAFFKVQIGFFF